MTESGNVSVSVAQNIGTITFFHPKSNSLPGALLRRLRDEVSGLGENDDAKIVVLRSEGEKVFCAGASFDELAAIDNLETGKSFFMGFGRLILAMKKCPKFIITRVQSKAVGGGVGIIAASDYVLAHASASIKLSELSLGIGPFVIGPAVEKKVGSGAFSELAVDTGWHNAAWAQTHGLYAGVYDNTNDLNEAVSELAERLAHFSPEAMAMLKNVFWQGTNHWDSLMELRAEISGKLVMSDYTANAIAAFKKKD